MSSALDNRPQRGLDGSLNPDRSSGASRDGILIVNADDWGRDRLTTDRTLECSRCKALSSVSAMVFMADSERAASLALEHRIDAGLHLNFTTPFSAPGTPPALISHQESLTRHLRRHRLASAVFHPGLVRSFEYVVTAQLREYRRLYGADPARLDGHHHMHLCANVLFGGLLPPRTVVRRNFSFQPGDKSVANRLYRRWVDRVLARQHSMTDFFFSLPPLEPPDRLSRIFALAGRATVEVETHPAHPEEFAFLTGGKIFELTGDVPVAACYSLPEGTVRLTGKPQVRAAR